MRSLAEVARVRTTLAAWLGADGMVLARCSCSTASVLSMLLARVAAPIQLAAIVHNVKTSLVSWLLCVGSFCAGAQPVLL